MRHTCSLTVNGTHIRATLDQTLIDAAMSGGILIPHDCCTGQCETCRVRIVAGQVDPLGSSEGDTVLACQARVVSNAEISFEEIPLVTKRSGQVTAVTPVSPNVVEVRVRLTSRLAYLPGQYVNLTFRGFPERAYSPSIALDGTADEFQLVFHIRRLAAGIVSSELLRKIGVGHRVSLRGPFGHAYLRAGQNRLVFVSRGTGFAPIWSMALASCLSNPERPMVVVAGAIAAADLYMNEPLAWLSDHGVKDVTVTAIRGAGGAVREGSPLDYLPGLLPDDVVYAAGAPEMVHSVKQRAQQAGVRCYADPFTASAQKMSLRLRLSRFLRSSGSSPQPAAIRE